VKRVKYLNIVLASLLTAAASYSQDLSERTPSEKIEFTEFELDNGLKVVLSRDTTIPSVAINIAYHVGSKDEEPNKTGFAHLFEHLMFEGSKHVPPGDYDRLSLLAGGENNAYTTEDKTNYYIILPSNQLELGLWLESDRMLEFAFQERDILNQKEVVKEEKRVNTDNRPYGTVGLEFAPRLFRTSGYRWETIGNMADIDNATYDDIKRFFERFYVPNNAVLTIVGDIDIEETKLLVHKYFDSIPRGAELTRTFYEPPLEKEIKDAIYDNVQFPAIFIGYRVPQENTREYFIFDILTDILSDGESSRFYRELVYEKRIFSEIGSYIDGKEYAGVVYIYGILMPGRTVGEGQKGIDGIISGVREGEITEAEIQKAKNKAEARFIYRRQTIQATADLLAHYKTFYDNPGLINTVILNYDDITKEQLTDAAKKFLENDNRVVLYYLPKK
jgi:zinc protease